MEAKYPIVAVVAMAENWVIGDGKTLLWHIPDELKRTRERTMGRPLIMGRRTFESIGRALPGRANIVLTRRGFLLTDGADVVFTIEEAIAKAEAWIDAEEGREKEIIIFGGGQIYTQFMSRLDYIDATLIEASYDSKKGKRVAFPRMNFGKTWKEDPDFPSERIEAKGDIPAYSYVRYLPIQRSFSFQRLQALSIQTSQ